MAIDLFLAGFLAGLGFFAAKGLLYGLRNLVDDVMSRDSWRKR